MNMIASISEAPEAPSGGTLSVRLAASAAEIEAAQALRYAVFYDEMGAQPDGTARLTQRDQDRYDAVADHLIVIDATAVDLPCGIVATYRLIGAEAAARAGGFYSAGEFDIAPLLRGGRALELGRSCVHPRYRSGAVLQLLWRGIAEYVHPRGIDLLFGCASLPGINPDAIADQLSLLGHHYLTPAAIRPVALPERFVELRRKAEADFDPRQAFMCLPPLLKGYLRLGGTVGDGAVIDAQFNTTDVALVVSTERITSRYLRHYLRNGGVAA